MIRAKSLLVSFTGGALALSAFSNTSSTGAPGADPSAEPTAAPAPSEPATPMALYFGDADGDGLEDALVVSPEGRIALLHNEGKGEFLDITLPSGLAGVEGATCALFADFDGDGAVDLFLGSSEKRLWRNLGGASFQPVASGVEHDLVDLAARAGDVDGDGQLDLYAHTEAGELVYRNTGSLSFEAVRMPSVFGAASGASAPTSSANAPKVELDESGAPIPPSRVRLGRWIRMRNAASNGLTNTLTNTSTNTLTSSALMSTGMTTTSTGPLGLAGSPTMICAGTLVDQGTGQCIEADSVPTIGSLYPLSNAFNVDSAGKVGIGTPSPVANLHVSGPFDTWIRSTGDNPAFSLENTNPLGRIWSMHAIGSDLNLRDDTAGANRLTISPTGNVGIGTSTPGAAYLLDVNGNMKVGSTGVVDQSATLRSSNGIWKLGSNNSGNGSNNNQFYVYDEATGFYAITAQRQTRNVGINTTTPSSRFEVYDDNFRSLRVRGTANGNAAEIFFDKSAAGAGHEASVGYSQSLGMYMWANGAIRMAINSAGLVSVKQSLEIRGGADIVERFESSCGALEPGTVVAIDPEHPGKLACAVDAYDTKVAGVVSGAGGVQPGLCLSQDGMLDGDTPVAMNGRVYVKCTASNGAIRPGDRLTTSDLAGHAMKVTDSERADGAVIGKAMTSLESGEGLVLVLVNLQ